MKKARSFPGSLSIKSAIWILITMSLLLFLWFGGLTLLNNTRCKPAGQHKTLTSQQRSSMVMAKAKDKAKANCPLQNQQQISNGKYAIVSLIISDDYVDGVSVLGESINRYSNVDGTNIDKVLLYAPEKLSNRSICLIKNNPYWSKVIDIDLIPPPPDPQGRIPWERFYDMFTKLVIWNMTDYEQVLYVDLDTLVVGDLNDLFMIKTDFAVGLDVWKHELSPMFNAGIIYLRPNRTQFELLMKESTNTTAYDITQAEQGMLNYYYKYRFFTLPYQYNVNLALKSHPQAWNVVYPVARIIHYTLEKPFGKSREALISHAEFGEVFTRWSDIFEEVKGSASLHCSIS